MSVRPAVQARESWDEAEMRVLRIDDGQRSLVHAVSHELQAPLAAIRAAVALLAREPYSPETPELVEAVAAQTDRMTQLIRDILDADRLRLGIIQPSRRPTDLGELVRRVLAGSPVKDRAHLRLDLQPVIADVDAPKVERIIDNLLTNVERHVPAEAAVWVGVRPEADAALIVVEDCGPGIPETVRDNIFEPFAQASEACGGLGLGLSIVARFAELHGGRAWVEQRPGGGASFRVLLPARLEAAGTG